MIVNSIVSFLKATFPADFGIIPRVYVKDPKFIFSDTTTKPFCIVEYIPPITEEQWTIGDAQRKINAKCQITALFNDYDTAKFFVSRLQTSLQSMVAIWNAGTNAPGMNLMGVCDLLYNPTADLKTYLSYQPNWFTSPVPVVYKNGFLTANIVSPTLYTVDYTVGKITFASVQLSTDKIYATYKTGVIDFVIDGIVFPIVLTDIANKPHYYNVAVSLSTWYHIKATADRLI